MRKYYPYLQEQYMYNLNEEQNKRDFLKQLDDLVIQKQYIQITLLDWQENPIKEIQGELTGGSLSKDSSNCVRTVGSLSCSVSAGTYSIDSLNSDFALNKKIFIEIGIRNDTNMYADWPILWFPQGIFLITDFALNSSSTSVVSLNISIKDKMCLLNGDVGGKLPSYVQFDVMDTQAPDGTFIEQKVLIYDILLELLNHFGGEDLNNIIIQDVPLRIRQVMKWNGSNKLYGVYNINNNISDEEQSDSSEEAWTFTLDKPPEESSGVIEYEQNADVGYIYSDFIFTDELAGNIGESITSILDKIKNYLGNYEYFYNEFGIFIFREIKNYLNITQAEVVEDEMTRNPIKFAGGSFELNGGSENQYLIETINEKTLYAFDDDSNVTSITVTPQYGNIKNDYIVSGLRQGDSSDTKHIVRYRLAIDSKPDKIITDDPNNYYYLSSYENVVYYYDELERVHKLGIGTVVDSLPSVGNWDKIYLVNSDYKMALTEENFETSELKIQESEKLHLNNNFNLNIINTDIISAEINPDFEQDFVIKIKKSYVNKEKSNIQKTYAYKWDGQKYIQLYYLKDPFDDESEQIVSEPVVYYPKDWRTALYLYGLQGEVDGTDKGAYYEDLSTFWPQEYCLDPNNQCFKTTMNENTESYNILSNGNFYLDFIDAENANLGEYSIDNIGRREDVVSNDDINCLFLPEIPNIVFLNKDNPRENWSENTASTLTDEELIEYYKETIKNDSQIENKTLEDMMLILQRKECTDNAQPWTQVGQEIYSNLSIGGYTNSAYEQIRYELFCHTRYQKTVSITSIPVYYLSPNSRVQLESKSTNTYGDFMVQNINLTFGPGANMSVVLNEAMERL